MECGKNLTLHIVRHGLSAGNVADAGFVFNEKDPPLMPLGEVQARRVSDVFASGEISAVYASPLERAVRTAIPTAEKLGLPVFLLPSAAEKDTAADAFDLLRIKDRFPLCTAIPENNAFTGGEETAEAAYERAKAALSAVISRSASGDAVIIFSHGTFGAYLLCALLGVQPGLFRCKSDNCSITTVRLYENEKTKLCYMNDVRHLRKGEIT